ncbi:MAG TPA: hypothetical protein VEJ63_13455 [Planctomycetota bacterium]|nr:hypothetical protein [Planctomycetota bacterium]
MSLCLLTAGCESQRREPKPEAQKTAAAPAQAAVNVSALAAHYLPPLRRTGRQLDDLADVDPLVQYPPTPLILTASRNEDGQVTLRAVVSRKTPALHILLMKLGLQQDSEQLQDRDASVWTRRVKPADRAALESTIIDHLFLTSVMIDVARQDWRRIHSPGRPAVLEEAEGGTKVLSGRVLYTGIPLDIAMADAGRSDSPATLFIVARDDKGLVYLRGGRLFVGPERTLRTYRFTLPGLKAVAEDTSQVLIGADGKVRAQRADGTFDDLGALEIVRIKQVVEANGAYAPAADATPEAVAGGELVRPGHLEFSAQRSAEDIIADARQFAGMRIALEQLLAALHQLPRASVIAAPASNNLNGAPIVIHADLPWSADHLKALGIGVERTPAKTVIAATEPEALNVALVKVLGVLRLRMGIHDQNLRNAERIRDAENRINPYRRKTIKIGPQGEAVEALDPAPFPKNFKPGDPNADAEGFVLLPNVNRTVETAEFQAAIEEYRLVRSVLERLSPNQFFPDPPTPPALPAPAAAAAPAPAAP